MFKKNYVFIGISNDIPCNDSAFYQHKVTAKQAKVYAEFLVAYYHFFEVDYYPVGKKMACQDSPDNYWRKNNILKNKKPLDKRGFCIFCTISGKNFVQLFSQKLLTKCVKYGIMVISNRRASWRFAQKKKSDCSLFNDIRL